MNFFSKFAAKKVSTQESVLAGEACGSHIWDDTYGSMVLAPITPSTEGQQGQSLKITFYGHERKAFSQV